MLHIVVGFIVGLIASAIMHTHMGFIGTTVLGILGSVIGGLIARLFSRPAEGSRLHPAGFLMSIIGAGHPRLSLTIYRLGMPSTQTGRLLNS